MVKSKVNMLFALQKCENTTFLKYAIKILILKDGTKSVTKK